QGEPQSLVAIVTRSPVALAKGLGQRHLGQLLAVAENAELGLAAQHLTAADQADLPASIDDSIVADDLLRGEGEARCVLFLLGGNASLFALSHEILLSESKEQACARRSA